MIKIQLLKEKEIIPWLPIMHAQTAKCLKGFPYLYAPSSEQVVNPADTIYVNDKEALVAIVTEEDKVIGTVAGIPLSSKYLAAHYFSSEIIDRFNKKGYDPRKIWYMGYFLLNSEYQSDESLIRRIYDLFVKAAQKLDQTQMCYVDVIRSIAHPQRPIDYVHPEPYGRLIRGFAKTEVEMESTWPTMQSDQTIQNETHQLVFYINY